MVKRDFLGMLKHLYCSHHLRNSKSFKISVPEMSMKNKFHIVDHNITYPKCMGLLFDPFCRGMPPYLHTMVSVEK